MPRVPYGVRFAPWIEYETVRFALRTCAAATFGFRKAFIDEMFDELRCEPAM